MVHIDVTARDPVVFFALDRIVDLAISSDTVNPEINPGELYVWPQVQYLYSRTTRYLLLSCAHEREIILNSRYSSIS